MQIVFMPINWVRINSVGLFFLHPCTVMLGRIKISKFVEINIGCYINSGFSNIAIGEYTQINASNVLMGQVEIGKRCMIGPLCVFAAGKHHFGRNITPRFSDSEEPNTKITIGNDVWIGAGCSLLGTVIIGDNCVIYSGCIIKDMIIPDNTIVKNRQMNSLDICEMLVKT